MRQKSSEAFVAPHDIARLGVDWPNEYEGRPRKGDLVRMNSRQWGWAASEMDGQGWAAKHEDLALEPRPALSWRDFPQLLEYYLHAKGKLPNLEPMSDRDVMNTIAAGGGMVAWPRIAFVLLPGDTHGRWARVFLQKTQGGNFDGRGWFIAYRSHGEEGPQGWRFQLCAHTKQVGAGANPRRGWHPGSCTRCGLNMTVDSGD